MNALSGITERQKFCLCNVACEVVWYCLTAGKISSGRLARTGLDVEWNLNERFVVSDSLGHIFLYYGYIAYGKQIDLVN